VSFVSNIYGITVHIWLMNENFYFNCFLFLCLKLYYFYIFCIKSIFSSLCRCADFTGSNEAIDEQQHSEMNTRYL